MIILCTNNDAQRKEPEARPTRTAYLSHTKAIPQYESLYESFQCTANLDTKVSINASEVRMVRAGRRGCLCIVTSLLPMPLLFIQLPTASANSSEKLVINCTAEFFVAASRLRVTQHCYASYRVIFTASCFFDGIGRRKDAWFLKM